MQWTVSSDKGELYLELPWRYGHSERLRLWTYSPRRSWCLMGEIAKLSSFITRTVGAISGLPFFVGGKGAWRSYKSCPRVANHNKDGYIAGTPASRKSTQFEKCLVFRDS